MVLTTVAVVVVAVMAVMQSIPMISESCSALRWEQHVKGLELVAVRNSEFNQPLCAAASKKGSERRDLESSFSG